MRAHPASAPLLDVNDPDIASALAKASFELSFEPPDPQNSAQAVLVRAYWLGPDKGASRICVMAGDLRRLRGAAGSAPGAVATALAFKARAELLAAGAIAPPSYVDDFPSAAHMASADVCSCSCSVGWPIGLSVEALDAACARALDAIFEPGTGVRRHMKSELSDGGRLEKAANALILQLRAARAPS